MKLDRLTLAQYRSYSHLDLDLSEGTIHLFVGNNGAGKTNVLEAVSVLAFAKSCRGSDDVDVMQWDTTFFRATAEVVDDDGIRKTFEVASQIEPRKQKACFIDDVKVSVGDMVGALPVSIFLPEDLDLFTGSPQRRRSFLDQLLCQVSPEYLNALVQYQKQLKQRNRLLKMIAERGGSSRDELDIWDDQLVKPGAFITLKRLELLEVLQCTLHEELSDLGERWDDASIAYERKSTKRDLNDLEEEMCSLLREYRDRDIMLQSTTMGPHRDDWRLDSDGRSLPTFASRGQQRTAILALLLLQVSYLELRRGERPVVLLDDVFSELDDNHQEALLTSLRDHQVIITSTHVPPQLHGATLWDVEPGAINRRP